MMADAHRGDLAPVFAAERPFLWGLCYRMTGCAADADDLVQDTFVRAVEHPPPRTDVPWRPWLVRVAMNLSRDLYRRRRRRAYVGPWLPSPIDTGDESSLPSYEPAFASGDTTAGRYDWLESISFAFLLALEALTPQQRAVLLLRDVFDYDVRECAMALGISEGSVKVTHHRARAVMGRYDHARCIPTRELQERTRAVIERLTGALLAGDARQAEALLAPDVRALSDGGGEFFAARKPVVGADRVARFYSNIARNLTAHANVAIRMINGLPALVVVLVDPPPRTAPLLVTRIDVDGQGRVMAVHSILATAKTTALR